MDTLLVYTDYVDTAKKKSEHARNKKLLKKQNQLLEEMRLKQQKEARVHRSVDPLIERRTIRYGNNCPHCYRYFGIARDFTFCPYCGSAREFSRKLYSI